MPLVSALPLAAPYADFLQPVSFLVLSLLLIVGLRLWLRGLRRPQPVEPLDYERRETLFTAAEVRFLLALQDAVEGELVIVGKVRLADLIRPAAGLEQTSAQLARQRIRVEHLDFVLLDPSDFAPLLAIELDDCGDGTSQGSGNNRQDFINFACERAGLPLLRFPVADRHKGTDLRAAIAAALHKTS